MQQEQLKASRVAMMSQEETDLIDQEMREMPRNGAISAVKNLEYHFLST